jgi:hypothetical protein
MDICSGIGSGIRGFSSDIVKGVSDPPEGSKILTFLFRTRLMRRTRSYVSEARGENVRKVSDVSAVKSVVLQLLPPLLPILVGIATGYACSQYTTDGHSNLFIRCKRKTVKAPAGASE